MKGYKTSKDYKRLKELLDSGYEVVCFVTYDFNEHCKDSVGYFPLMTTDLCSAKVREKGNKFENYSLSVRGCSYIEYWSNFDTYVTFEKLLDMYNVEFIEPTTP